VNYTEVPENSYSPEEVYTQSRTPIEKINLKSGSTVHFWWLVNVEREREITFLHPVTLKT
jgi:hypothetical protein